MRTVIILLLLLLSLQLTAQEAVVSESKIDAIKNYIHHFEHNDQLM